MPDALEEVPARPFWDQLPEANRQRLVFLLTRWVHRKLETKTGKEVLHE